MFYKVVKNSVSTSCVEDRVFDIKKRKIQQKTSGDAELQMALALSKSLHDADQHDLARSSKSLLTELMENNKESLKNIKDELTVEFYNKKFRKRKLNNPTTLQLSNTEIRDRILTKNLARILMENEVIENDKKIHLWECLITMQRVTEYNNLLQKYDFVDYKFWDATTYRNEHLATLVYEDKFVLKENVEENTNETFEYLIKKGETESMYKQKNTNKEFSEVRFLVNDDFNAIKQINRKDSNKNSVECHSETAIPEIEEELYEDRANEDNENFNILWNLVNLCSVNENIHESLKKFQSFPETNQQLLINLINIFDLNLNENDQSDVSSIQLCQEVNEVEHKFNSNVGKADIRERKAVLDSDSDGTYSSKILHEQDGNLINEETEEFVFDNEINGSKEGREENSLVDVLEQEIINSTKNAVEVSTLSFYMTELAEEDNGSIKSAYSKKWKTHYSSTEFTNAYEPQELESDILNVEEMDDLKLNQIIHKNLSSSENELLKRKSKVLVFDSNNVNDFENMKENIAANGNFCTYINDYKINDFGSVQENSKYIQKIDNKLIDSYDRKSRVDTPHVDGADDENGLPICLMKGSEEYNRVSDSKASTNLKFSFTSDFNTGKGMDEGVAPFSATGIDNVRTPVDYSTMETPQIKRELQKYGLKLQKRHSAVKLLKHIHGKLHPAISESHKGSRSNTVCSTNKTDASFKETYSPTLCKNESQRNDLNGLDSAFINKTRAQAETGPEICFKKLDILNENRSLVHNTNILERFLGSDDKVLQKIFKYQPLELNIIRTRLKAQGIRCKNHLLQKFLDDQSVTYFTESKKERRKKK